MFEVHVRPERGYRKSKKKEKEIVDDREPRREGRRRGRGDNARESL